MKTQNNKKLDFKKESIIELNDNQLEEVNGGGFTILVTTLLCCAASILICSAIGIATRNG